MGLKRELENAGAWLFRFRSYVPLIFLVPFLIKMSSYRFPFGSDGLHGLVHIVCGMVTFSGLAIRLCVAGYAPDGTSGRNTREQRAATLNTTGLYSIVRHPLYLGNFLMWAGIPLFCGDAWLMMIYTLGFWLYYERIMYAEECFLHSQFGEEFSQWAARTPAFVPWPHLWIVPDRRYSWRRSIRQEYTSFFLAVQSLVAVELLEHWEVDHRLVFEPEWIAFSLAGLALYLIVRIIKKRTSWLVEPLRMEPSGLET